jgi:lysozyme
MSTLQNGSSGGEVTMLQRALSLLGYSCTVDGSFGPGTQAAVEQFQTAEGLSVDGVVGPNTWAKLDYLAPQGMDISHFNTVTWGSLSSHIQFVFHKYSQGATYKDPTFNTNLASIKQLGLLYSPYHFLTFQDSAQSQIDNFMACWSSAEGPNVLPPVLDVEWQVGSNDADTNQLNDYITNNPNTCLQIITDWINGVASQTGRTPIIYTAKSFWNEYFSGITQFAGNPLWIPAYQQNPPGLPGGWNSYALWQYSENASIPGVPGGSLDLDIFNGNLDALKAL